jgi:hypothetical protein
MSHIAHQAVHRPTGVVRSCQSQSGCYARRFMTCVALASTVNVCQHSSQQSHCCMYSTTSMHPTLITATDEQLQPLRSDQQRSHSHVPITHDTLLVPTVGGMSTAKEHFHRSPVCTYSDKSSCWQSARSSRRSCCQPLLHQR